jgi:membrane fusion protein (multidrug efflux system)
VKVAFEEGSEVKAGELLFKLEDEDLVAGIASLEARRLLASQTEERRRELLTQKGISRQEYDAAKAELDALDADLRTRRVELAKTEVRAPFAGRTGFRLVSPGAWVTPSTPLVSLQDVSQLKVDFSVPEKNAVQIRDGQPFSFKVAGSGEVFTGVVAVIEPEIDASTRGLLLRGLCRQPGAALRPGAFAEVTVTLDAVLSGFPVPTQAVVPSAKGPGLFILTNGKAEFRDVSIGLRTPDKVQVLSGIKEGDTVLTTNLLRLRPGLEVRLSAATAKP